MCSYNWKLLLSVLTMFKQRNSRTIEMINIRDIMGKGHFPLYLFHSYSKKSKKCQSLLKIDNQNESLYHKYA